jgi:tetratricopeptide (TPR) repeat protein
VDEIVVYDTGSTDRTRDIAREHGARVIEGYWNDHFSDARNRSLAHCTGQWVLILDADEVISGDPDAMRAQVSAATGTSFFVGVESLTGHGTTVWGRQLSPRLVRRNRLTFIRRLHEQMVDRVGGGALPGPDLQGITLTHSGYTLMRSVAKNKHERNLRLAHLAAGDQKDGIWAVVNLARSQMFAGRFEEAIETAQGALDEGMREQRAGFLKVMVEAYEGLGRYADAHATLDRLREVAQYSATADELEARVCNREGDFTRALAIVEAMPEDALDDSLIAIDESRSAPLRIESLFGLRRYREAAQALRDCVREGQLPHSVESIAEVLTAAGSSVAELAILHPRPALRGLLLAATEAPDALADDLFEALWQQHGAAMILASAARIGGRLPVMRAMEWAARLRQHGYSEQCTLLALAGNPVRTPRDRVLAAAIALELFSDERAMPLLEEALGAVPDDENDQVLQELRQLAPTVAAAVEPAGVA